MSSHLWLAPLDAQTVDVFATAFTLSAKKRGNRVSTERFLAALPDYHKASMTRLCEDAKSECKMSASASDLPAPELPPDWQEQICFSTCIESTLLKCGSGTDLVAFLKLLCKTAVRLRCIVDRSLPIDSYLTRDEASLLPAPPPRTEALTQEIADDRWQCFQPTPGTLSVDDDMAGDVLGYLLSKASSVEALRKCKAVSKAFQQAARDNLCDVEWLLSNHISVHDLLKKGRPSPHLVLALAAKHPTLIHERDGEGLLPLQYAAAYRMDADVISALRQATASHVPGSAAWANSAEACSIKSQLRPVRTRVSRGPIAA
jgi:hypothetical protein